MSQNVLNCRACGQVMVITHHGGRRRFVVAAEHVDAGLWRLSCPYGAERRWREVRAP